MALSACLLTRDDEATLAEAILSVAKIADQVVVLDTGSTDRTLAVASESGAEVHTIAWDDDFAAGRNSAIALARGDWILWLNPDEAWVEPDRAALDSLIGQPGAFGYMVRTRAIGQGGGDEIPGESWDLRLFRKMPSLAFVGRLHPALDGSFMDETDWSTYSVRPSPVVLRSLVSPSSPDEAKRRWMLRLLERELGDRPGQLRYLIELARVLASLNDPRAEAARVDVAAAILSARDEPRAPTGKVSVFLESVVKSKRPIGGLDAAQAIVLTLKWFRDTPPLLWAIADRHYTRGEFAEAAAVLEHLVDLGERKAYDRSRAFEAGIVGDQAIMNLGACYARIGRPADARSCFSRLLMNPAMAEDAAKNLRVLGG